MWYRIKLSYAVFGILVKDGKIIDAASIGRWMIGKPLSTIQSWVSKKRGKIDECCNC